MFNALNRRTFLRAAGVCLALPFLEAMSPALRAGEDKKSVPPRRMVAIGTPFGFDPQCFVPASAGRNYKLPPHLEHLKNLRDDFSVISGLHHPDTAGGGHKAESVLLTGAPCPTYFHNYQNTISIDQEFASHFRGQTRYDSLVLSTCGGTLSYTHNGVEIPAESRPSRVFADLFLSGTPQQAREELRRISEGRSLLDLVGQEAARLGKQVSASDRARLDEYFDSVRALERQLQVSTEWVNRPKPHAPCPAPQDILEPGRQAEKLKLMLDMIHLALVTDSTRAITLKTFGDHHELSHHGKEAGKLSQCRTIELELMKSYASLLTRLKASQEGEGRSILDSTMVLMTSNLMDGNSHMTYNLPVLLAGGGFRHGQHLAFNKPYVERIAQLNSGADDTTPVPVPGTVSETSSTPLCNLYVSMLQRAGIETARFGSGASTLTGLEQL